MSKFILSKAMGNIPDDMLLEAMAVKKSTGRHWIVRAAACAAVLALLIGAMFFWPGEVKDQNGQIVAVPGILKAYAYEVKDNKNIDFTKLDDYDLVNNDIDWDQNIWSPLLNYRGIAITPLVSEADFEDCTITFEVTTNRGELFGNYYDLGKYKGGMKDARMGHSAIIGNGETLYWEAREKTDEESFSCHQVSPKDGQIYIDIVIKADDHIIGYAIFEIVPHEDLKEIALTSKLVETVYYPKVDGEFQNITEEFVCKEIAKCKAN